MGYPAQNTSVAALIAMLGDLKHYAKKEGEMTHYYYKPVIALLNHKLIKSSCSEDIPKITNYINTNNIVYVAEKSLQFTGHILLVGRELTRLPVAHFEATDYFHTTRRP